MPPKQISRKNSRSKSSSQKKHQERAAKAMKIFKSGKAVTLKQAWKKV